MSHHTNEINFAGVTLAAIGTAAGDYALQLAGLVVTLIVAYWNLRSKKFDGDALKLEVERQRSRADFYMRKAALAQTELVRLRSQPTAVSPPFPPGEAAADA